MILLSQTYEVVSEESAADGEAAENGFNWQDVPHGFRETVDMIKNDGYIHPPCSRGVPAWLSTEAEQDTDSGDCERRSLHPARDARSQRYWAKACRAAGIVGAQA